MKKLTTKQLRKIIKEENDNGIDGEARILNAVIEMCEEEWRSYGVDAYVGKNFGHRSLIDNAIERLKNEANIPIDTIGSYLIELGQIVEQIQTELYGDESI